MKLCVALLLLSAFALLPLLSANPRSSSWKIDSKRKAQPPGPVKACDVDGEIVSYGNVQSGCKADGTSYICNNQQSYIINYSLAYGFAAAAFINPPENMCCTCFLVTFKLGEWDDCSGKQIIVQITNTGGSSITNSTENNIEFNILGGGVGYYTLGCKKQWNAPD
ncbi:endoglucanase-like [Euwallacea fornicatus]|uniref:endoglucanase-like n=1 Tax=Euwallacea fornicatus TaxID=995702 RepID=UPI00338DD3F5